MVISCSSHINQGPSQISPDNKQCHSGWPWPSPIISPVQVSHNLISKSTQPIVQCCLLIRGSNQSPRPAGRSGESTTSIVSACRSQTPQIKILDDPWPRLSRKEHPQWISPSQRVSEISPGRAGGTHHAIAATTMDRRRRAWPAECAAGGNWPGRGGKPLCLENYQPGEPIKSRAILLT